MVVPVIAAAAAETSPLWVPAAIGAGGLAAGFIGGALLSKKDASIANSTSQQNVYHAAMENYQPSIQYAPVNSYAYQGATTIINSPNASAAKLSQAVASDPTQTPSYTTTQSSTPTNSTGSGAGSLLGNVDFTTLAIIGAVAIIGYALLRK
ncbi:MAG: hypothetical protein PHW63_09295 [Alphaproteobacteria bacterium]|nr:hypothetical protein [Alphaproteobacteria bacterium]